MIRPGFYIRAFLFIHIGKIDLIISGYSDAEYGDKQSSVVYFENYSKLETVKQRLEIEKDNIQCIVADEAVIKDAIPFGESQNPKLWDYADNVDTAEFLLGI